MSASNALDPRVRAVLAGTDPYGHPVQLPGEAEEFMTAALAELGEELSPPQPGIGLVLGSGVIELLQAAEQGRVESSGAAATHSRLDKRC